MINPSDILSRDAWESAEVQEKLRTGEWIKHDCEVPWDKLAELNLSEFFDMYTALGG